MKTQITYQLDPGKDDVFILDKEYIAFKNNECYPVYKSSKPYNTGITIGHVRIVFDEEGKNILGIATPLFGLNNDFQLMNIRILNDWAEKISIFKKFKKEKKEYYETDKTGTMVDNLSS